MKEAIVSFFKEEDGLTTVEYAIAGALVAGTVVIAFQELGQAEWAFYRPRWGAFHETSLEARLDALGVTTLVVCGFNFTTAMRTTIFEASARDFRIVVVSDAVGSGNAAAVQELARIGVYLMPSDGCLDWLAGGTPAAA